MTDNDKRQNFLRLAEARTNAALEAIRKIKNLSNKNNYDYSPEAVDRMFDALSEALEEAKMHFKAKNKREFRF